jgi:hypothetical protein
MSTTTQYQVTDRILNLAESHQLVNQVRYGFLSDIDINFEVNPITFYLIPGSFCMLGTYCYPMRQT